MDKIKILISGIFLGSSVTTFFVVSALKIDNGGIFVPVGLFLIVVRVHKILDYNEF